MNVQNKKLKDCLTEDWFSAISMASVAAFLSDPAIGHNVPLVMLNGVKHLAGG
jgi:hypothetical protein